MQRIKEKRKRQRIDVVLPIKLEYNQKRLLAKTKNISVLGTYIEVGKAIPIGTAITIKINIPCAKSLKAKTNKEIKCAGTIFRCQPIASLESQKQYGIGIFFRFFFENGEKDLSRYIDCLFLQEKKLGKIYIRKRKQKQIIKKGGK
jgi:hypothetical protein